MLNRFCNTVGRCEKELPYWSMDAFERQFMIIEMRMVPSAKLAQKLLPRSRSMDVPEGDGTTSSTRLGFEDYTLRGCKVNGLCISAAMLSNYDHRRVCRDFLGAVKHVKAWRVDMHHRGRDPVEGQQWFLEQVSGVAWSHVHDGLDLASSQPHLQACGFLILGDAEDVARIDDVTIEAEEEHAAI